MPIASRRSQRYVDHKLDIRDWRIKKGLLNPKTGDLTKEGIALQERRMAGRIGSPGWKPEVEPLTGEDRGVYCKTAGGIRCFAQDSADDININVCRNCNDLRRKEVMDLSHQALKAQQAASERKWQYLKRANPATRPF